MVTLTINNQKIEVEEGINLLTAIESLGIKVPTLCYHKALIPYGACRLCVVEVQVPGRESSLQASCSYPVIDGINVFTNTERITRARKIVAELLLARCPDSEAIKKIAAEYGVKEPRIKKKNEDCILCGLCVRMCEQRMGRSAIGFTGRGPRRKEETPFGKHNEMCWICGACNFICPVGKKVQSFTSDRLPIPIPDSFNIGLSERASVYVLYPQAIPNKPAIDNNTCLRLNYDVCGICEEVCEAKAIDYEQNDEIKEIDAGAIIFSPGYEIFDAKLKSEYGYGHFPNVISALEFERILNASGPYSGEVLRPLDKSHPKKIAFIQCVGSRDYERDYCSSVCCMYATKEAIIAKEHVGEDLQCDIFFMHLRAFSKGFEEYYIRAKKLGINYLRCRPASVEEIPETKNLIIKYLTEDEKICSKEYDLVVLSVGMVSPKSIVEQSQKFGIKLNEYGFCDTSYFSSVKSSRDGIYVAGPFEEPKDIPETVMQASAAAAESLALLSDVRGTLIKPKEYPPEINVTGQEPRIGVFICHCGTNIAGVVNVPEVLEYTKALPNIVYTENNLYTCSGDTQEKIKKVIIEQKLNRVVVASCTPRTHEPLFRNTLREAGLNPYLFEMANIRDQCSWVHMHEPEKATKKAKDLVRMAIAKSRLLEPLYTRKVEIIKNALVIGGGLSGMTSALNLANQGFEVHIIEKEKELGGNLRKIHYLLNDEDPQKELRNIISKVNENKLINVYTSTQIISVEGFIGNFKTSVTTNTTSPNQTYEIQHGIVVVATGAKEYKPIEYLYGKDEKIITQRELEEKITNNELRSTDHELRTIVMIQCVGSRDDERPYCSRICCQEAIKNALKLKEINPEINIFILYRDIRTYGFKEKYYTKAREKGVIFIRYDENRKPEVSIDEGKIIVNVSDTILNMPLRINTDLLVLSSGIVAEDNENLSQMLKVPLNQDKFFLEAHMKLRPVDFATEGIFLCGLAHSPKLINESIPQALASASRASTILSKDYIELEATISNVVDENCDGCAYCIDPCPYKALTLFEYMREGSIKKTVEVNESLCKGCGTCMATCPKKGIFVKGFKLEQIAAQAQAALLQ